MAARCLILRLWTEAFFPKWMRNSRRGLRRLRFYCIDTQWSTGKCILHIHNTYIVHTWFIHICIGTYMYIHGYDMSIQYIYSYVHCTYMSIQYIFIYIHCTYMFMLLISVIIFRPDGLKSSSKRLLLCCKTLHRYVPCKSGIRYPSLLVMLNRRQTQSKMSVMFCVIHVHTKL